MSYYVFKHTMRKLGGTLKILALLFCARTFGRYEITRCGLYGELDYAVYHWRGRVWGIPTGRLTKWRSEHGKNFIG
jgi:hypothetical protein